MTDDFLRRHPEIVERLTALAYKVYPVAKFNEVFAVDILPVILRAHEADLAGDAGDVVDVRNRVRPLWVEHGGGFHGPNVEHAYMEEAKFWPFLHALILRERAAAYLAGRAAGREEAAAKAREYAGHYPQGSDGRNTFILLAEWLEAQGSLP